MSDSQKLKYRITDESKVVHGVTVFRIEALRDIVYAGPAPGRRVLAGQKGGFVSNDQNLSQEGQCWVADDAVVMQLARVSGGAWLEDKAQARNWAVVDGTTKLSGQTSARERINLHDVVLNHGDWSTQDSLTAYLDFQAMVHQVTLNHSKALLLEAEHHLTSEGQLEEMLDRFLTAADTLGDHSLQSKLQVPVHRSIRHIQQCIQWRKQMGPLADVLKSQTDLNGRTVLKSACSDFAKLKNDLDASLKQVADDLHFNKAMANLVNYQPFDNLTFTQVSRPAQHQQQQPRLKYA